MVEVENVIIYKVYFQANISTFTANNVGRLFGILKGRSSSISSSYYTRNIFGKSNNTGELVGFLRNNASIKSSYST
jgi:hypothetical protein